MNSINKKLKVQNNLKKFVQAINMFSISDTHHYKH